MSVSLVKSPPVPTLGLYSVVYLATAADGVPSYGLTMRLFADSRADAIARFGRVTAGEPFSSSGVTYTAHDAVLDPSPF
jgi:hypothetical protein